MSDTLFGALDALVPDEDARGDWDDVLARSSGRRNRPPRRALVVVLATAEQGHAKRHQKVR